MRAKMIRQVSYVVTLACYYAVVLQVCCLDRNIYWAQEETLPPHPKGSKLDNYIINGLFVRALKLQ